MKKPRRLFFLAAIFISIFSFGQNKSDNDSLRRFYENRIRKQLTSSPEIISLCVADTDAIRLYATAADKKNRKPEYIIRWKDVDLFRRMMQTESRARAAQIMRCGNADSLRRFRRKYMTKISAGTASVSSQPLKGWKIAIDPGHIAADLATGKIERKYLDFDFVENGDTVNVEIAEGKIAWETADLLRKMLEADGAEVMLTRTAQGLTAFGKTYSDWIRDDYKRVLDSLIKVKDITDPKLIKTLRNQPDDTVIFREVFRTYELRKRAEIINSWHPDATVIIHYNVDETNIDWKKPVNTNYCMTFVPGCFTSENWDDKNDRFDFLRLLLSDDLTRSIALADSTVNEISEHLKIPIAGKEDALYLSQRCIEANKGVFHRNLALCRLIDGPLVYGETLYQDNRSECIALMKQDYNYAGLSTPVSSRVGKAAEAYAAGIRAYARQWPK